jgi:uncharacterized protein YaaQ
MKLIVAIVQDYDCDRLLQAVNSAGLGATRIASTGGFLRTGNTTVLMGVEDDRVMECLKLIQGACEARIERPPEELALDLMEWGHGGIAEVTIGGAVVFVVGVQQFVRLELVKPMTRLDAEDEAD